MTYDVIGVMWLTGNQGCFGIVAIKTLPDNWKSYMGNAIGGDEEIDKQYIAATGAKLPEALAIAAFPRLDPEKFTY